MKRWLSPLLFFAIIGVVSHFAVLLYAPSVIMNTALSNLEGRGVSQHAFTTPVRITPQTQAVVRSSPDLFYSLCRYDLSEPGSALNVTIAEWPDYQSLSFFDEETNNFVVARAQGEQRQIRLIVSDSVNASSDVSTPLARGVVLIRRLAPTRELFDQAKAVSADDRCELITGLTED